MEEYKMHNWTGRVTHTCKRVCVLVDTNNEINIQIKQVCDVNTNYTQAFIVQVRTPQYMYFIFKNNQDP